MKRGLIIVGLLCAGLWCVAQAQVTGSGIYGDYGYLTQIATRSFVGSNTASANPWMSRSFHYMRGNSPTIRVEWTGWYVNGTTFAETNASAIQTIHASLEYPSGTCTPFTFAGSSTGTIPIGGALISDPLPAPPNGAKFYIRRFNTTSTTLILAGNIVPAGLPSQGDALLVGSDQTVSCTAVTDEGFGEGPAFPQAILGLTSSPSAAIIGDSRSAGVGDTTTTTGNGDNGNTAKSIGPNYAYINAALPGEQLSQFLASNTKQMALLKKATWMVSEIGVNDIFVGGVSTPTIESSLQSLWALWPSPKVTQNTLEPVNSSTDNWETLANQSVSATPETVREAVNTWIRGTPAGIKKYFDVTSAVESSLNSGKWIVNGTANWCTADGTHETTLCYGTVQGSGVIPSTALQ